MFSYKAPLAEECEYLLQKLCDWINDDEFDLGKGKEIATGVLKAVVAHLYLAWIHAFSDGNGRTARLVELALLLSCGVPTAAAHLLSNFYNETRPAYYAALNKSSKERTRGALHFIEYAIKGFREELKSQLEVIQTSQMKVAWINYVHSKFSETKPSEAQKRRRDLILELTKQDKYTFTREEIRVLSPRIEQAYRDKTDRTLSRDLNCIEAMKLIKNEQKDYRMETTELLLQIIPLSLQDITSLLR